ncbi:MAG TPA: ABC transporter permease subunit [Acidimicrobiia bacterium]
MTTSATTFGWALSDRLRSLWSWLALGTGVVALQVAFATAETFPAWLDTTLSNPVESAGNWIRANRRSHALFTGFLNPVTGVVDGIISGLGSFLLWLPWFVVVALAFMLPARVKMWKQGLVASAVLLYTGIIGLWVPTMQTLALMSASVLIAVVIGVPLGVWGALSRRAEHLMRPVLDAMQTVPAFVYFLPLFFLLGIGNVPAAVATVIYALPPVVRLTTLGIKQVPSQAVEASRVFGSTPRQTMLKVQLPMALPTILTGLSQTIMMALGIVVLATLIGASGLGSPVLQSLNQRRTGRGIAAGLAIVAVAMVLDRVWRSIATLDPGRRVSWRTIRYAALGVAAAVIAGRALGWVAFPHVFDTTVFDPIDGAVRWSRDNLTWLTRPVNDFIVADVYIPLRDFMTDTVSWPVLVLVAAYASWRVKGWRLALFTGAAIAMIGLVGMWELSIDTLVQVMIATVIAVAVAVPIGVWAGLRPRVESALGPILDALQTIPSLVYIIPVVILFTVGIVPGVIASVLYAMVPGVRITALGIRNVPDESIEASKTFGATPRQTLFGVRLPLAAPVIMVGVNQVIMMVLAMVIIAGLVGGGALGFETVVALTRSQFGHGVEVGLAIVLIAMVLDRSTQAAAERLQPPAET